MEKISIIVPCYNEEEAINYFYEEIKKVRKDFSKRKISLEVIFVDDGSSDNTLSIMREISKKEKFIKC